jgi:dinuclear metal center YbgI/SA1388 family protein
MATLADIAAHLDALLRPDAFPDNALAFNGLQVETPADIQRIATAVDARERTIEGAHAAGANLLLVHHGLFWKGVMPLRGPVYRRVQALMRHEIGVYSSHIPLDAHPDLGNNVLLARTLGLVPNAGFAEFDGVAIGVAGESDVATEQLVRAATEFAARYATLARHTPCESGRRTRRWGICTGAGADVRTLREASERGIDTMIVGEGPHWSAIDAEEAGIVLIYAGHYATETLGVRALGEHLTAQFGIPSVFVDVPTGL